MKKTAGISLTAALVVGMVGVTGCGVRNDNDQIRTQSLRNQDGRTYDVNSLRQGDRYFSRSAGNGQSEKITSLRYSAALSNKVAQLREVQAAHVVVTDRDAYVAVTLHNASGNGINSNSTGRTGISGLSAGDITDIDRGLAGRSGTAGSLFDLNRGNDWDGRKTNGNMWNGMATGDGADGTFNGWSQGTAGTGRVTDHVPQTVQDQITAAVKQGAPHVRNVYVSNNSDFVSRIGNYATQSRGGSALQNMISDFQTMIDRVFPDRAGTIPGPNGYAPTRPNGTTGGGMTPAGINNNGYSGGVTR